MAPRAAILLLVLLALAACGGGDEEEGGAVAPTATAADAGTTAAESEPADEYAPGGGAATTDDDEDEGGGAGATLEGEVGPGFEISLEGTDGLEPGTYTIRVDDRATSHNFHLTGPGGVDVSTSVPEESEESFEVTLEPGEYTFLCDPHASQMRGTFTVAG